MMVELSAMALPWSVITGDYTHQMGSRWHLFPSFWSLTATPPDCSPCRAGEPL